MLLIVAVLNVNTTLMQTLEFLTEVAQRLLGPEQTIKSQASVLIKGLLF